VRRQPPASGLDPRALTGATHDPSAPPPRYTTAEQRRALVIPLIPLQPPCFERHADWVAYVTHAAESAKADEVNPLRFVDGKAQFNTRWSYCSDCLPAHAVEMDREGRCKPKALREREKEKAGAT
jgi:hypothetical protein